MSPALAIAAAVIATLLIVALAGLVLLPSAGERRLRGRLAAFKARYATGAPAASRRSAILRQREQASVLDEIATRFLPAPAELERRLRRTGRAITLGRYLMSMAVVGILSYLLADLLAGLGAGLALPAAVAAGLGLPHMAVARMIRRRQEAFLAQFPDAIDLIVRALKSGLPLAEALKTVAQEMDAPVGPEFARIVDSIRLGRSFEDAMADAARRLDFPDFQFFVVALAIQRETGGNLAETLANLSDILRQRHQMKLKVKALSSEGRASAWIVGSLPFVMFAIIYVLNRDYAGLFFTDPRATTALVGGLIWMGVGTLIIRRMIHFEI